MKTRILICLIISISAVQAYAQKSKKQNNLKTTVMKTDLITNPIVARAISALQKAEKENWFSLFTINAELYDDGHKMDFRHFFENAIGHERFTFIDKVENGSMDIYGRFHSDKWGDFKTYFKFKLNADGKFERLEIGQATY